MRSTDYTNETIRKRIIELEQHYIDILNEKLSVLGGYWVTLDDEGYTILNYIDEEGLKQVRLGFNDIMNIYGGKNLDDIVERIIERAEGKYYGTKYVPIETRESSKLSNVEAQKV